jgi:hypothetical protein
MSGIDFWSGSLRITRAWRLSRTTRWVLRSLAFVTALYNDLVSIPEDMETGACNGVLMLTSAGLEPGLPQAIDRAVDWHNRALIILQRLLDEVDDPTLRDLCEGFVAGMAVWQNAEIKYIAGARALVRHGQLTAV